MARTVVLVVEDNLHVANLLKTCLAGEGFAVTTVRDAETAIQSIRKKMPDLVLLDWMLPGADGDVLLKHLRGRTLTQNIPIIMLTAKDNEECKVNVLEAGADDYITKPFSVRELCARVRSVLRRAKPQKVIETVRLGKVKLKPGERQVWVGTQEIGMMASEFDLLHFFMLHPGRVYSRVQILNNVWGRNKFVEERTVDVQIGRLRKVLKQHDTDFAIETVRGFGYRMKEKTS